MEIPYKYHFVGKGKDMKKIQTYISSHPARIVVNNSSVMSGMNGLEKILTVTDDDSDLEESADIVSSPWVRCGKHTLTIDNKIIVEPGDELTDKHIQMAQYLIKC